MPPLALIPIRSGSKTLPDKNIAPIMGKPLVAHTIECAQQVNIFDRIIVLTDSQHYADIAQEYGAQIPFLLPPEVTQDTSPVKDAIHFALNKIPNLPEHTFLLEATSYRLPIHITQAWDLLQTPDTDSLISVIRTPKQYIPDWTITINDSGYSTLLSGQPLHTVIPQRQSLSTTYTRNGAIYAFKTNLAQQTPPRLYGDQCRAYIMDPIFNIDIDTQAHLNDFEKLLFNNSFPKYH